MKVRCEKEGSSSSGIGNKNEDSRAGWQRVYPMSKRANLFFSTDNEVCGSEYQQGSKSGNRGSPCEGVVSNRIAFDNDWSEVVLRANQPCEAEANGKK